MWPLMVTVFLTLPLLNQGGNTGKSSAGKNNRKQQSAGAPDRNPLMASIESLH